MSKVPEKKKKILIVDDEVYILQALSFVLKKQGYEVFEAVDGVSCLQMFDKVTPNLVILDIKLPKMNGYEVCKCIRKKTKIIPVVMLTAATVQEADIIRCGATTCIFKPFSVKDVINKVEYLLNYKS